MSRISESDVGTMIGNGTIADESALCIIEPTLSEYPSWMLMKIDMRNAKMFFGVKVIYDAESIPYELKDIFNEVPLSDFGDVVMMNRWCGYGSSHTIFWRKLGTYVKKLLPFTSMCRAMQINVVGIDRTELEAYRKMLEEKASHK